MSEAKEMWRVAFHVPANQVFSESELKEQGFTEDNESDNISFEHTYIGTEEQAIADCMLDYHLMSKCDIYDIYRVPEYLDPDYA